MTITHGSVKDKPCCDEHYSPAHYVLEVGSKQIALCPRCVKDLKEKLEDCREYDHPTENRI